MEIGASVVEADGHRGVPFLKDVAVLSARNVTPCEHPIRHCRGTIGRLGRSNILPRRETSRKSACARVRILAQ